MMDEVTLIMLLYVESEKLISLTLTPKKGIEARLCDVQRSWGDFSSTSMHTAQRVIYIINRK